MSEVRRDILHCIVKTSLMPLRKVVPENGDRESSLRCRLVGRRVSTF